ncbi:metallophosphoesterase family protein [bacterium]|nr:metallophosphoesterase family protein [bacterium]
MRIALISDIHGNIEAFEAVIEKLLSLSWDKLICLGDVVGYGANPEECTERAKELCETILLGNHEWALISDDELASFNPYAQQGTLWTRENLPKSSIQYLTSLPRIMKNTRFVFSHSNFVNPLDFSVYITAPHQAKFYIPKLEQEVFFFGHTHIPSVFTENGGWKSPVGSEKIPITGKALINPGSVGQPRDGDWRASFAIFDDADTTIEFFRVEYDVEKSAEKIISAGLPESFATRIFKGM